MKQVNVKTFQMIIGVFCLLAIELAMANPKPGSEVLGHIKGRLIDANTRQPLSAVTVYIAGTDLKCVTDSTGTYRIVDLSPGAYDLICTVDNVSVPVIRALVVNPGRTTWHRRKIDLPSEEDQSHLILANQSLN